MTTKITIECEGDPDTIRDAVTIIEQMLPYMTDNVIVRSETDNPHPEWPIEANCCSYHYPVKERSNKPTYKLAKVDPQELVNLLVDQAVEAYQDCYITLDSDQVTDSLRGIVQGFSDALAAVLSSDEEPADVIIERLASERAGLGEER